MVVCDEINMLQHINISSLRDKFVGFFIECVLLYNKNM